MEGVDSMACKVRPAWSHAATLLVVAAVALGAAACGDSDDGGSGSGAEARERTVTEEPTTPEGHIEATYDEFAQRVSDRDLAEACALFSDGARRKFAAGKTCVASFNALLRDYDFKQITAEVVRVRLKGSDRATAMVKDRKSESYPVPFVREAGEWKLDGGWTN